MIDSLMEAPYPVWTGKLIICGLVTLRPDNSVVKNPLVMQETLVRFLCQEDPVEILGLPLWLSW